MNIDGINPLACTYGLADIKGEVGIYPLPHLPVIRDLVPGLAMFSAQHASVKPWLETVSAVLGPAKSVQTLPLPHHNELRQDLPEGVEPGKSHPGDQVDASGPAIKREDYDGRAFYGGSPPRARACSAAHPHLERKRCLQSDRPPTPTRQCRSQAQSFRLAWAARLGLPGMETLRGCFQSVRVMPAGVSDPRRVPLECRTGAKPPLSAFISNFSVVRTALFARLRAPGTWARAKVRAGHRVC